MHWLFYSSRFLLRILFFLLTRWRVRGKENVPRKGPVLIVANHMSLIDVPLLAISPGRNVVFMAKKELFHSRCLNYLFHGLGAFPVDRGKLDRKALQQAIQALADGWAFAVFPEGVRSRNAQLQPAFPGSALIALRSGAPVLPVGITGTEKIKGLASVLRRPKVTVNIGRPFYLPPANGKLTKVELAGFTDSIMRHIAELLPLEYRGSYAGEGD